MHPHTQKTSPQSGSPAVAATCLPPAGLSSSLPIAPAEAAGGRDNRYRMGWPCVGIEPYKGWTLHEFDEWDGEGFCTPGYFARGPICDVRLNASRFTFEPSDARFRWLVDNGFGAALKVRSPFSSEDIDRAFAGSVTTSYLMASAASDVCARILAGAA